MDRWTELQDKRQTLQEQVNELKAEEDEREAEVIEFARQHGVEVVTGSTQHAEIQEKTKLSYPRSSD